MTRKDLTSETAPDTFNVEAEARRRGIQPYQVRATGAVNDRLMADIVSDFRNGPSAPSSMATRPGSREPEPKGNGWQDPVPLSQPPGLDIIDAMVNEQSRKERLAALQQELELRETERRFRGGDDDNVQSEYNPFSREWLKK